MKKLIAFILAALLLCLTGCGADEESNADFVITRGAVAAEETEAPGVETAVQAAQGHSGPYGFVYEGVELIPGEAFDASRLPEAVSVAQVPSCAIEGTDNVYHYGSFELTAFDDGSGEVIYSIYLLEPDAVTPEGLALGDEAAKVNELLGEDYQMEGTAFVYTGGQTQLSVIVQNGTVVSIEYRLTVG